MGIDLDKLEQLARAATPGPWEAPHQPESVVNVWTTASEAAIRASDIAAHGEATGAAVFHELGNGIAQDIRGPDAAFIAVANPAAVLELVQELRQWREGSVVALRAGGPVAAGAAVLAIDSRRMQTLTGIVRDVSSTKPVYQNNELGLFICWYCGVSKPVEPGDHVDRVQLDHVDSCAHRRAVEATKP
jgi:hypothetical protein